MFVYIVVGIAGIVGALLRYYTGMLFLNHGIGLFPTSTFVVNMVGSFILGWFTTRISKIKNISPYLVTGLGTGLIGSFTTFSTFSVETVNLMRTSHMGIAFLYIILSVIGGLLFSLLGYKIGDYFYRLSRREIK